MPAAPQFQIGLSMEFLGVDLKAGYEDVTQGGVNKKVLICKNLNAGKQAKGMSVKELVDTVSADVQKLGGAATPKTIPWPEGVEAIVANYQAYVNEVFLKIEQTGDKKDVEYALWIGIRLDQAARDQLKDKPPFNLVEVKDIFVKLWNTDNKAVLDELSFVDLDQLAA